MEQEIINLVKALVEALGPIATTLLFGWWLWIKYGKGKMIVIGGCGEQPKKENGNGKPQNGGNGKTTMPPSPFLTEHEHDWICASRIESVRGDIKALAARIETYIDMKEN